MVTPPRDSLKLYIDARVGNAPSHAAEPSFSGFLRSKSAYNYDESRIAEDTLDAFVQPEDVFMRASDGSDRDDVSFKGSEDGLCNFDLNSVPITIGEHTIQTSLQTS